MNTERLALACHAYFFPEGKAFTSPSAGTASRTSKPDGSETTWLAAGVSEWTKSPNNTIQDFMAPAPGARVLYDRIATKKGLILKGKWMEMSNLIYKMLHGAAAAFPITGAGGQFNPLEGDPIIRGWLQLQVYDHKNVLVSTEDYYVALNIPGDVEFGENLVDVNVEAHVLFSTLNTGSLR
ncbi:MAG TPA: hypothetical protein VGD88_06040 [Opitutaceae bacterium]